MDGFDVSVVIPAYNAEAYVTEAVGSALSQTLPPREVIVVDDGSTDGTRESLEQFGARIRIIGKPNGGLSAARNTGIRASTGQWIAFLDADDLWSPRKLDVVSRALQANAGAGLVFSAVRYFWDGADSGKEDYVRRRESPDCQGIRFELMARNVVLGGGSGPVVRREALLQVGLFDEALTSAEDWDAWIRLAWQCEFVYVEEPLTYRREHALSMSRNISRMLENDLRVFGKYEAMYRASGIGSYRLRRAKAAVYSRSGVMYFCSGQTCKARAALTAALRLDPLNVQALVPMAKLLLGLRPWEAH